jgi:hypothetical protein
MKGVVGGGTMVGRILRGDFPQADHPETNRPVINLSSLVKSQIQMQGCAMSGREFFIIRPEGSFPEILPKVNILCL